MAAKNCLVVVTRSNKESYVVRPPGEDEYFSKKDAQRQATVHVQQLGMVKAEVVEVVFSVKAP